MRTIKDETHFRVDCRYLTDEGTKWMRGFERLHDRKKAAKKGAAMLHQEDIIEYRVVQVEHKETVVL